MNIDPQEWLKIAQNLSFTSFLLLCVGVLAYALYRLYLYSRTDWAQVQQNADTVAQMNQNIAQLITKIDQLINELHTTQRLTTSASLTTSLIPPTVNDASDMTHRQP